MPNPKLIFCDSFDHYNDLNLKWDVVFGSNAVIDLTGTLSRTGPGCCNFAGGSVGPKKFFSALSAICFEGAFFPGTLGESFLSFPNGTDEMLGLQVQADGTLQVFNKSFGGGVIFSTGPGAVLANAYSFFKVVFTYGSGSASALVFLNNIMQCNLTGLTTSHANTDTLWLLGAGGAGGSHWDDVAVYDATLSGAVVHAGAPRIYAPLPFQDSTPLQWTPSSAGAHFSLVNEVPPDGDTSYVSTATPGQIDEYLYQTNIITPPAVIIAAQHVLDTRAIVGGSATIGSSVSGLAAPESFAPSTAYHMFTTPYDNNPNTSAPWLLADFPTTPLGPVRVL